MGLKPAFSQAGLLHVICSSPLTPRPSPRHKEQLAKVFRDLAASRAEVGSLHEQVDALQQKLAMEEAGQVATLRGSDAEVCVCVLLRLVSPCPTLAHQPSLYCSGALSHAESE